MSQGVGKLAKISQKFIRIRRDLQKFAKIQRYSPRSDKNSPRFAKICKNSHNSLIFGKIRQDSQRFIKIFDKIRQDTEAAKKK